MEKGLYDIHNHILPGVDDGSQDIDTSMELIDMEYNSGVRHIIFTPHYMARSSIEKNEAMSRKMTEAFEEVKRRCEEKYPDVELRLGNELLYSGGIIDELKSGRAQTMGDTHYILTEFNTDIRYPDMKNALKKYIMSGYKPIIAHVERYACLYREYERMDELKESGVLFQINAENFLEGIFSSNKRYCTSLIKDGYVEMLSTDTHNKDTRRPNMKEAVSYLAKKIDRDVLDSVLYENPARLFGTGKNK